MRIMIKGGVWKNTEDEILKAAVMKYGKNQWARVASLLNRKSSKQCKARWYEWLDPSIKKTEWTRDEEEKLLHLAKLYPCQWRTIAPLVGRTAAQCMDRYERLLDQAERELGGGDDAEGEDKDDVRRLRPGEIDPDPETRPARPDPVDMDEDEKEMLSEARARLANTRGKKAKRKAREAQLDEARRLASLQKKRELKAAGIYSTSWGTQRKGGKYMDYSVEVPFQKLAPAGFYDVGAEKSRDSEKKRGRDDADFEAIRLDRFEEQRRDEAEKIDKRDDRKKRAKLMKQNLPMAVAQLARLNDPSSKLRRSELELPAPQVDDDELEDIARLAAQPVDSTGAAGLLLDAGDDGATQLAAAARTARTPARNKAEDPLAQEARNAVLDRTLQTPLLGEHQADREDGTGYAGATPSRATPRATPLSLAAPPTPLLAAHAAHGGDRPDDESFAPSIMSSGARRKDVRAGLAGLPAPKFAYDVDAPADVPEDAPMEDAPRVTDARARDEADAAKRRAEEEAAFKRRSLAVQRGLPRPRACPGAPAGLASDADAEALVAAEAVRLVRRDAVEHPVKGGQKPAGFVEALPTFSDDALAAAKRLVLDEAGSPKPDDADAFSAAWAARDAASLYLPTEGAAGTVGDASAPALVAAHKSAFEATRAQMAKGAQRAARVEARVAEKVEPLVREAEELREAVDAGAAALDKAAIESACYLRLYKVERRTLPARLEKARARGKALDEREAALQKEYADLVRRRDALYAAAAKAHE